ncbi:MAG: alpha/beta fold hydrolase [Xanthomonadaceae bacterium]|nr:alpha/beta fold hydrolase [Xanthomonadaceae bacterium]
MSQPVIATLHGWAMHHGLFEGLVERLPNVDWRGLDLPGHGLNRGQAWPRDQTKLLRELFDPLFECASEPVWLLGWSLGGLLAMQAMLEWPQRFRGLILISATPCFVTRHHWPDGVDKVLLKAMAMELADQPERVFNRFLALETHGSVVARGELDRLKALALRHGLPDHQALLAGLNHLAETDLVERLGEIARPALLLGGRRDRLVAWAALERLCQQLDNARLVNIAGAAHAPFLTAPDLVAAEIRRFIGDV